MKTYWVCAIAAAISFILGVILYKIFIPMLRKVKLGQKILEIGPSWHKSKEGTPNLGGLIFIFAFAIAIVSALLIYRCAFDNRVEATYGLSALLVFVIFALSQGLIGFVDDYVKLFKKRNKGLSSTQKLILQTLTTAGYLFSNSYFLEMDTAIDTPWGELELGIFYYVIMLLAIVYIINCANLTDGIDGLAGSVAFIICTMLLFFGIENSHQAGWLTGDSFEYAQKYDYYSIAIAALLGALLAFLVFNFHPAKIFMGDTGSLFLGGFIVGAIMFTDNEFLLIPVACIWILEGLSVVLQVFSFKVFGKRIFKMSPIHHHFEKCGWGEVKIVLVFSLITVAFSTLTYYLLNL
jgi:phospho-N-acetylmuramoyl-pentapeptide-transferase